MKSYSFKKTGGGGGAPEALLEVPSFRRDTSANMELLATKNNVLLITCSDFDYPSWWHPARAATVGRMLRESVQHHTS
jgi:hypothetical protein